MKETTTWEKLTEYFDKNPIGLLLIFFLLSVAIRLPNLDRPLSKHHELNAALVLITAEEWDTKTPEFYHYIPVHSYHNAGDFFNDSENLAKGYTVNVTIPPLWYIMPYAFFHVLHLPPSPMLLQIFNLLLHLICLILVYKIALLLFSNETNTKQKAVVTCFIYLFCPAPLWFHGNGYVHEIAVLPFVFGACLVYLKILTSLNVRWHNYLLFFLIIIAGVFTDWLMCFVAASMFACSAVRFIKNKEASIKPLLIVLPLAVLTALALITWHAASFMGFNNYTQALLNKFLDRGITGNLLEGGLAKKIGIVSFYLAGYAAVILLILYGLTIKGLKQKLYKNQLLTNFLIVGFTTCVFHHIIFWGFSNIHDYAVVKSGLVLSLIASVVIFSIDKVLVRTMVIAFITLGNIAVYYYINRPGNIAANGQPYNYFQVLGEKIKEVSGPEDYIFIDTPEMSLILTYYSKRSYKNARDVNKAYNIFKNQNGSNAVFIHTDSFKFISYTRLQKN